MRRRLRNKFIIIIINCRFLDVNWEFSNTIYLVLNHLTDIAEDRNLLIKMNFVDHIFLVSSFMIFRIHCDGSF